MSVKYRNAICHFGGGRERAFISRSCIYLLTPLMLVRKQDHERRITINEAALNHTQLAMTNLAKVVEAQEKESVLYRTVLNAEGGGLYSAEDMRLQEEMQQVPRYQEDLGQKMTRSIMHSGAYQANVGNDAGALVSCKGQCFIQLLQAC